MFLPSLKKCMKFREKVLSPIPIWERALNICIYRVKACMWPSPYMYRPGLISVYTPAMECRNLAEIWKKRDSVSWVIYFLLGFECLWMFHFYVMITVKWKMAECNISRCSHERRMFRRELHKWSKEILYILGEWLKFGISRLYLCVGYENLAKNLNKYLMLSRRHFLK